MQDTQIDHAARGRNSRRSAGCTDGLAVPSISQPDFELEKLTAGGREIYRRTRRPATTCNAIADLAGIGQMGAR